ncbi:MAG TPA: hypothetical protein VNG71_15725 [Pyrinomonadaceae bacterium]|nr:hypothetical protein [Pyrinomonadaceae bacterium]
MTRQTKSYLGFSIALSVVVCLAVSATMFMRVAKTASQQPQKERLLHRLPVLRGEPIVITDIKVGGKSISFEQKFIADDDWLKGLVVSVKNRSDKRILLTKLEFFFPPPPGSQSLLSVFHLSYGNYALLWGHTPTAAERLVGIGPGEAADIACVGQQYENFRRFFADIGHPSLDKVDLRLRTVIFEDDTMWDLGDYYRRNANDPASWSRVDEPPMMGRNRGTRLRTVWANKLAAMNRLRANERRSSTSSLSTSWNSSS